jgi:hypothetical protein
MRIKGLSVLGNPFFFAGRASLRIAAAAQLCRKHQREIDRVRARRHGMYWPPFTSITWPVT